MLVVYVFLWFPHSARLGYAPLVSRGMSAIIVLSDTGVCFTRYLAGIAQARLSALVWVVTFWIIIVNLVVLPLRDDCSYPGCNYC